MKTSIQRAAVLLLLALFFNAHLTQANAQVPGMLQFQSRILVGTTPFTGTGQFKFALVNADGSTTYWSNDGTSASGSEPTDAVSLPVAQGLYSVLLGDTSLASMTAIPPTVFANSDVRLRVWFDDGVNGFQQLSPDQRMASAGYALNAAAAQSVAEGAIGEAQLAPALDASLAKLDSSPTFTGTVAANAFSGDGSGLTNVPGTSLWQTTSGTAQTAESNQSYLLTNDSLTTITLPSSPALGEVLRVSGSGAGSWRIAQNSGQSVVGSNLSGPSGVTWTTRVSEHAGWWSVASSADGSKLVAAAFPKIYTSTDSGATWTPRGDLGDVSLFYLASSADGNKLVAVALNGGRIYTSTDSGVTWTPRESNRFWTSVASSADGSKLVAAAAGLIYTSTDSGETWTARDGGPHVSHVASSADGSKLVALGNQISTSTDSGVTWTPRAFGLGSVASVASSADGGKLVAVTESGDPGAEGGQIFTSTDSGVTWTAREISRDWTSVASSATGGMLVAVAHQGQIFTSTDSGVTWTPRESHREWTSVASSADGSKLVAVAGGIYTSESTPSFSTTVGVSGYLKGDQYGAVELQFIGNGRWMLISSVGTILAF